ncbi:hypothetical protein N0V91_009871 [Didymella pomorum]|uniref:Uncharacterized protein n=1 Tax=Didymella pomorum TaxID=749634 RepID=A0A9W8Z4G6_9PLEO|nr:hypothetical protein N0V91_009871 [Didymella pomorum]
MVVFVTRYHKGYNVSGDVKIIHRGRKWTSDRFREALKRESTTGLGQALTIAAYREIAIGISRRFLRASTAFRTEEGEDNEE